MASGTPIASIGVKIGYKAVSKSNKPSAVDWTTGTTAFTRIYDIKSTPDFNTQPNTADATTFDNLTYTTSVELLKDIGGALEFSANLTSDFKTAWASVCTDAADTTKGNGGVWFGITIPGIAQSIMFYGKPSALGLPSLSANTLAETSVYVTPITEPEWVNTTNPV